MTRYILYKRGGKLVRVVKQSDGKIVEVMGQQLPPQADWRAVAAVLKAAEKARG